MDRERVDFGGLCSFKLGLNLSRKIDLLFVWLFFSFSPYARPFGISVSIFPLLGLGQLIQIVKMKIYFLSSGIFSLFTLFILTTQALNQISTITTTISSNNSLLQLAGANITGNQILLAQDEWWGVVRAAQDLASDLGKVVSGGNGSGNGSINAGLELAYWGGNSSGSGNWTGGKKFRGGDAEGVGTSGGDQGHDTTVLGSDGSLKMLYNWQAPTNNVNVSLRFFFKF